MSLSLDAKAPALSGGCACGARAWLVGRTVAECAECGEVLPIAHTGVVGVGRVTRGRHAGGRVR